MNKKHLVLLGAGVVVACGLACGGFFLERWLFPPGPPSIDHQQALRLLGEMRSQYVNERGYAPSKADDLRGLDGHEYVLPLIERGEIEVFWQVQAGVSGMAGTILAWEKTADEHETRWALFLDGHVARVSGWAVRAKQHPPASD
jgi:hypothetical protein